MEAGEGQPGAPGVDGMCIEGFAEFAFSSSPEMALSSKSYWHRSRTLATQTGTTNDWLKSQGLISVRALWMKAHGYA